MRRLLTVSSGIFINSFVPIITWFLIALIFQDSDLAQVFILTYPFQFISTIIIAWFGTGANIRQTKEQNQNIVWSSILVGVGLLIICFTVPMICCRQFLGFMQMDDNKFVAIFIYALLLMMLQGILGLLTEKLYFEDREKLANRLLIGFNILNLVLISLITLLTHKLLIAAIITVSILAIYVLIFYIKESQRFRFDLNIFKNLRYDSASICTYALMFIIYFCGNQVVFAMGPQYIAALNLVTLCIDAQWDASRAIRTVAKVDIAKQRFRFRAHYWRGLALILILVSSSAILYFSLFTLFQVELWIGLIYLALQIMDFIFYALTAVLETYAQLEISATLTTIGTLLAYVARTIVTVIVASPFCEDIGQLANSLVCYLYFIPLYFIWRHRQQVKKLS